MTLWDLKQYAPYIASISRKCYVILLMKLMKFDDEQAVWALSTIREYALSRESG